MTFEHGFRQRHARIACVLMGHRHALFRLPVGYFGLQIRIHGLLSVCGRVEIQWDDAALRRKHNGSKVQMFDPARFVDAI